jgi:hypothetical protein
MGALLVLIKVLDPFILGPMAPKAMNLPIPTQHVILLKNPNT